MLVRVAALGVFFIVPDWWKLIPAFLAIFLPYFAVVIANATTRGPVEQGRIAPNALPAAPTSIVEPPAVPEQRAPQDWAPEPRGPEPREPEPREPAA
jgi:hypothetical protein